PKPADPDPRTVRLKKFLSRLHCPVTYLAEDFIHAADENHLDWRLLPSISIIEASGGQAYKNNNTFDLGAGPHLCPTVTAGAEEAEGVVLQQPSSVERPSVSQSSADATLRIWEYRVAHPFV